LHDSQIVCSEEEKSNIKKFFAKPIKQTKLLYRASDHGFCIKKFHEKCDEVANTLTVVWTEFDRKIGGFTPLAWSSQKCGYTTDRLKESFIFSLTYNNKFNLRRPECAIANHPNYGPTFGGGHDLQICAKANSSHSNYTKFNHSYRNKKYRQHDKLSLERFHGDSKEFRNFKTKEWEVWAVEWTGQDEVIKY
jgi:hypothetical protein